MERAVTCEESQQSLYGFLYVIYMLFKVRLMHEKHESQSLNRSMENHGKVFVLCDS